MRYFVLVGEYGNITKAAAAAFTSQSNISKQIAQLEEELGVRLLKRSNIGVELTPSGDRLYSGLKTTLSQLDLLTEEVKNINEAQSGIIRLGLCDSMDIDLVVPRFFLWMAQQAPNMEIRIETQPFDKIIEKLATKMLDIAFIFSVCSVDIPGVNRIILNRKNPLIYFSKQHPLYEKKNLCLMDFSSETFVAYRPKQHWHDTFEVLPFVPHRIIDANSLNAVFTYVQAGTGVTVLGQNQSYLGKQSLETIEIPTDTLKVGADAIWLQENANPVLGQFIQMLEAFIKV